MYISSLNILSVKLGWLGFDGLFPIFLWPPNPVKISGHAIEMKAQLKTSSSKSHGRKKLPATWEAWAETVKGRCHYLCMTKNLMLMAA